MTPTARGMGTTGGSMTMGAMNRFPPLVLAYVGTHPSPLPTLPPRRGKVWMGVKTSPPLLNPRACGDPSPIPTALVLAHAGTYPPPPPSSARMRGPIPLLSPSAASPSMPDHPLLNPRACGDPSPIPTALVLAHAGTYPPPPPSSSRMWGPILSPLPPSAASPSMPSPPLLSSRMETFA